MNDSVMRWGGPKTVWVPFILLITNCSLCLLLYLEITKAPELSSRLLSNAVLKEGVSPSEKLWSQEEHHLLVVMILSSPKGKKRRDAIRQTWMKGYREKLHKMQVKFSIGTEGLSSELVDMLTDEVSTYGDLLLLPHLGDSYQNLTLKVLQSFVALSNHYSFSFLLKCDDDSFVVLDTILSELKQRESGGSYYWGFFNGKAHVHREGKWKEKSWFLSENYLPYALGGGYVLSEDLVRLIVSNSHALTLYNSEDVSVGVWTSPFNVERHHDVRFNTEFISRGCRNVYMVSHKQGLDDMFSKQKHLEQTGKQCPKEYQSRLSYVYNWTSEPTKCCVRVKGVP